MKQKKRIARGDDYPKRKPIDGAESEPAPREPTPEYIPYPKALKLLDRLNAKPEEIAAWVFCGPYEGGLAAYLNANELSPPPIFSYGNGAYRGLDYISPLMACWFRQSDISDFQPKDRYITGQMLIERWSKQPGINADAFIRAKIAESRLLVFHPIEALTEWTGDETSPPKEIALCSLTNVMDIEEKDFGIERNAVPPLEDVHQQVGSPEWRHQTAIAAANARHDRPGGSRDKREQIREIWASGKYSTRDRCAEEECAALGMSCATARKALRNAPDPYLPSRC